MSSHPVKFADHRDSESGEIIIFVCHVTLYDHVIRALHDLLVRSPSR